MQLIFHTGAHCTDDDRLLKCLLRNKEELAQRGIAVPGPGTYRTLLKEASAAMETADPAPNARDVLIDAILDQEVADRVILSNEHFFGSQRFAFAGGQLYPDAADRLAKMRRLFHADGVALFMAIRNPATFLPAVMQNASGQRIREALDGVDPRGILWSDCLLRIRAAVPDVPMTIWCNEDTPVIWGEVVRALAGLSMDEKIAGGFDLLTEIMTKEGMQRFRAYLHDNPGLTEAQKRRVIVAFLDKYAIEEELVEELDLPGWTDALVDEMTEIYEQDIARIEAIPDIRVISP